MKLKNTMLVVRDLKRSEAFYKEVLGLRTLVDLDVYKRQDYKHTAAEILKYVGTEKNVAHLEHCSTRLRFTLNDQKKVDEDKLKAVPGVMGVVRSNQFQIIIGNDVVEV